MTRGDRDRYLAVAASLALHAGALALLWHQPTSAPQPTPAMLVQVTLLAPSAHPAASPSPPSRERGESNPGLATTSEAGNPVPDTVPDRVRPPPNPAREPAARETSVEATADGTAAILPGDDARPAAVETATSAAAAGPSPAPEPSAPVAMRYSGGQVLASLKEALAAHFYYPLLARRKGWEGNVTLALRIEIDGRLTGIHVVGSSGYRVLDDAAVDSLLRARALPLPGGALGGSLDMLLPVQYRLLDARV